MRRRPSGARFPVLALDLGGTQLRAAAVAPDGTLLERVSTRTPLAAGAAAVVEEAVRALRQVRQAIPPDAQANLAAVGISAPGPLDPAGGILIDPPNLGPDFQGRPLAGPIAEALGLPAFLERDTHLAILGEQAYGAAVGATDLVYLTVSTGIGGAIVTGGRLPGGPDGVAGELGHLTVDLDGPPCGCGANGHLEAISSGTGIARAVAMLVPGNPSSELARRERRLGRPLEAVDVAAAEDAGDPDAAAIMARARQAFAAAMVSIVDVFNPQLVVVGGGIARGQGERLLQPAREAVARNAFRIQARRARIVAAALGDDVCLAGAQPLVQRALAGADETDATAQRTRQPLAAVV